MLKCQLFLFVMFFTLSVVAGTNRAPQLRVKMGVSTLNVNAGTLVTDKPLNSLITWQPTVAWDMPSFSSRIAVHYLQEMGGTYGLTPISGIGLSGYYYFYGISSGYELQPDKVIIQKSKPGPYILASYTPINFNMNRVDGASSNSYFSVFMGDIGFGIGYDYPFLQNMILAGEFVIRNGSTISTSSNNVGSVSYSGYSIFFSIATAYY